MSLLEEQKKIKQLAAKAYVDRTGDFEAFGKSAILIGYNALAVLALPLRALGVKVPLGNPLFQPRKKDFEAAKEMFVAEKEENLKKAHEKMKRERDMQNQNSEVGHHQQAQKFSGSSAKQDNQLVSTKEKDLKTALGAILKGESIADGLKISPEHRQKLGGISPEQAGEILDGVDVINDFNKIQPLSTSENTGEMAKTPSSTAAEQAMAVDLDKSSELKF